MGPIQFQSSSGITIQLQPDPIQLLLPAGTGFNLSAFNLTLTVFQNGSAVPILVKINSSDGSPGNFLTNLTVDGISYINQTNLSLPVSGVNTTISTFRIPPGTAEDTYVGSIIATNTTSNETATAVLNVTVNNTNPVTIVDVSVTGATTIKQGDNLTLQVNISKGDMVNATAPISIHYCFTLQSANAACNSSNAQETDNSTISTSLNFTRSINADLSPGNYYIKVAVEYPGDSTLKNSSDTFTVSQPLSTVPPTTGGGGGGRIIPQVTEARLEISSPSILEVSHGVPKEMHVLVRNTGNATAFNTSLSVLGIPRETWSIFPRTPVNISTGDEAEFLVRIDIAENSTLEGTFDVVLAAKSGNVSASYQLAIIVTRSIEDRAGLLIEEAENLREEVREFIDLLEQFQIDVSVPGDLLEKGTLDLLSSRNFLELGDYEESISYSLISIDRLDMAKEALAIIARESYMIIVSNLAGIFLSISDSLDSETRIYIQNQLETAAILYEGGRYKEAYEHLLNVKQILSPGAFGFFSPLFILVILALFVLAYAMYSQIFAKRKPRKRRAAKTHRKRASKARNKATNYPSGKGLQTDPKMERKALQDDTDPNKEAAVPRKPGAESNELPALGPEINDQDSKKYRAKHRQKPQRRLTK